MKSAELTDQWFYDHYYEVPDRLCAFLASDSLSLEGLTVADIGSGDGIIDLALANTASPEMLVGFDINPVNTSKLAAMARASGIDPVIPANLRFSGCEPTVLPASDESFDAVISWSAFEHIADPEAVLKEIRRVIRPAGFMFLQLWPFYYSGYGAHLEEWLAPFEHLTLTDDEISERVLGGDGDTRWAAYKFAEYQKLNKVTFDDLCTSITHTDFSVQTIELYTHQVALPPVLDAHRMVDLLVDGVLLTARPVS
jgi:ubiquinone/menaquinone biosynthesis C-methylase UbiE